MASEFQNTGTREGEIYLMDLLGVLKKHLLLLIMVTLLGGLGAYGVTTYLMHPIYQSQTTIYVYNNQAKEEQLTSSLAADLIIIATDQSLLETVIGELKMDMSYKTLRDQISVVNPEDSHMLTISVKNRDPQLAADICNCLCKHLREKISEIMNTDLPPRLSDARVTDSPVSPSLKKNLVIGSGACLMVTVLFILISYFMRGTIQSEEDISQYLGLYILGTIPEQQKWKKRSNESERMKERR